MVVYKVNKIKYSKEEKRLITWLRIINASSYEEIEHYAKGDDLFMQVMDNVQMYAESPMVGRVYEVEGWRLESAEEHGIKIGRTEGIKIGRTEGIEIGKTKGIEIGKTEGIAIGKKDQAIQTAKMMLGRNYSLDEISILTDLPKEELLNLR